MADFLSFKRLRAQKFNLFFLVFTFKATVSYVIDQDHLLLEKTKCLEICNTFFHRVDETNQASACSTGCQLPLKGNGGASYTDCKATCTNSYNDIEDVRACGDGCLTILLWLQQKSPTPGVNENAPVEMSDSENDEVLTDPALRSQIELDRNNKVISEIPKTNFRNLPLLEIETSKQTKQETMDSYFDLNFIISVTFLQFCFILFIFFILKTNQDILCHFLVCYNFTSNSSDEIKNALLDDIDLGKSPNVVLMADEKSLD